MKAAAAATTQQSTKRNKAETRSSSQWEAGARWLTWRRQLHTAGQGNKRGWQKAQQEERSEQGEGRGDNGSGERTT